MESKVHQINWFRSPKSSFYFWNQFRNFVYSNLQKSPPGCAISPTLNITDWDSDPNKPSLFRYLTQKFSVGLDF